MSNTEIRVEPAESRNDGASTPRNWPAAGGLIGAVLASACCVGPLVLLMLGISGAWIGNLTALETYKPIFVVGAFICIGLGFREVYFKSSLVCAEGSYCARPESAVIAKSVLWAATVLVALALTISWWAPILY